MVQILSLVALALPVLLYPAQIDYTSFDGQTYTLTQWQGSRVAVLTRSDSLNGAVMNSIVSALDSAWDVYADFTGLTPRTWPATTIDGRGSIAEVPDGATCGAGCGYLGFNGIEIASTYWDVLYNGVRDNAEYDQVLFYELGRNFWLYQDQLGVVDPFITGFAIANRFISMERAGITGGPFYEYTFQEFRSKANTDLIAAYRANRSLNWTNTLALNTGVPGHRFSGGADLAGAFMYQLYIDYGYDNYREFWRRLGKLGPSSTAAEAILAYQSAAYAATGNSYSNLFDNAVPEPSSALLFLSGTLALLAGIGSARNRQS